MSIGLTAVQQGILQRLEAQAASQDRTIRPEVLPSSVLRAGDSKAAAAGRNDDASEEQEAVIRPFEAPDDDFLCAPGSNCLP
jgi:hypothetical protein